jgi:hypothetical protein
MAENKTIASVSAVIPGVIENLRAIFFIGIVTNGTLLETVWRIVMSQSGQKRLRT